MTGQIVHSEQMVAEDQELKTKNWGAKPPRAWIVKQRCDPLVAESDPLVIAGVSFFVGGFPAGRSVINCTSH